MAWRGTFRCSVAIVNAMVTPDLRRYRYRVDATDRINWVDSWWLAFARENGASELTADSVIGRSLWDFVSGADTRRLFKAIHERVRSSGARWCYRFAVILRRYSGTCD